MGRTCEEILGRIPPPFHVDAALAKYPTRREQSLNTVLVQEMSRYNTLINTITTTLHAVLRAIEGEPQDLGIWSQILLSDDILYSLFSIC